MATLPPGYRALVPLDKTRHGGLGVRDVERYPFARTLNSVYLTAAEFMVAAHHFPIVFARVDNGAFVPVAITALTADANLFIDEDGRWARGVYVPAYVRRYPFFLVPGQGERPVGVDDTALEANDAPLFDADGKPTPAWQRYEALLQDMEGARAQTERLSRTLKEAGVLEPFEAHAHPRGGTVQRLRGLFRVDERKLNALPAHVLRGMMKRGELSRVYAHLMSLDQFKGLLERSGAGEQA